MERRAKIVATVGPSSSQGRVLEKLLAAGVDVVRLNLSHGTRASQRETLRRVRETSERMGRPVAIIVDLMGPRYRLGELAEPRELAEGSTLRLAVDAKGVKGEVLPVGDPEIVRHLRRGDRVLIDNGLIELEVLSHRAGRVRAKVRAGGTVSSRKGINLPDSRLPFTVSRKDRDDIRMAVEEGADFLAASYVGSAKDIEAVRKVSRRAGQELPIIAKLERGLAVENLDQIVEAADAVMVARGDLGVEVPLHRVPVLQKQIVEAGWRHGKRVIVATQMLESMMEHPRPTRAESSDIANAVFDGADALMLSGETAAGRYPIEAVETMDRIIREAEAHQLKAHLKAWYGPRPTRSKALGLGTYDLDPPALPGAQEIPETVSAAAVLSARQIGARAIVALSQGGFTARMIACRRPSTPVFALTRSAETARGLQLVWGVRSLLFEEEVEHHSEVVALVDRRLLTDKLAEVGDTIVILMGDPIRDRPPSNLMRIHRVRQPEGRRRRKKRG